MIDFDERRGSMILVEKSNKEESGLRLRADRRKKHTA